MTWNIVESNWKRFKGKVKAKWGKLTDDHRDVIAGKRVELSGKIHDESHKGVSMMGEQIPPRRIVLRGALAAGCSMLVPIALSGCDSKKGATSTSAPPASAPPASSPPASAGSAAPTASGKVSQASVQYQTQPKGEQKCGGCLHFIAESNTCKLVDGQISPEGWCSLWTKKA